MQEKDKIRQKTIGKRATTTITVLASLLLVLLFAQLISAAQSEDNPTPPATSGEVSPFSTIAPTTEELLASPESIERYVSAHTLPNGTVAAADLETSTKTVSDDTVSPISAFDYIITVTNSGGTDIPVTVTDTLPADVTYVSSECGVVDCEEDGGTVTWEGTVAAGTSVELTISVMLNADAEQGSTITNTAHIHSVEQDVEVSADITVNEVTPPPFQFMPFTIYDVSPDPGPTTLSSSRPNRDNQWTLSWTPSTFATAYELQETKDPNFGSFTSYNLGNQTSHQIAQEASPFPVFYYRIRGFVGNIAGPWSNTVRVVGAYHDDFESDITGWSMRRSTYRERVHGFYENGKYVMQVLDRWDWGLSSPLQPAPQPPYEIDFEARIVAPANLLSFGMVFGGDWNGENCPAGLSYSEWYEHKNCFNHFYNINNIFFGPIKLLFERVDRLEWCPTCGGSPMKRLGDINFDGAKEYDNIDPEGWNRYRIEVRENSIKVFAAKRGGTPSLQYEYNDTRWIDSPYFGFFASTDEYNNSTWRFEYLKVTPLD